MLFNDPMRGRWCLFAVSCLQPDSSSASLWKVSLHPVGIFRSSAYYLRFMTSSSATAPVFSFLIRPLSGTSSFSNDTVSNDTVYEIFTVRHSALHGLCDRNSVRLSVGLSVCHTCALCPYGSTYHHDLYTIW